MSKVECPDCKEVLIWNSDNDTEDADGIECIESFYTCPSCELFLTIIRKCQVYYVSQRSLQQDAYNSRLVYYGYNNDKLVHLFVQIFMRLL